MDKQRELFEALSEEFREQFSASGERLGLNFKEQNPKPPLNILEALNSIKEINAITSQAQTDAILNAVATILARYL